MKMFQLPINDKRIQSLTQEQIDFMLYSSIADDPEKLNKLENTFYDPDFDDEFEKLDGTEESEYSFSSAHVSTMSINDKIGEDEEDEFLGV